eukprot:TRINITY_DN33389_c1_g1_i1.p1 TRINITY_DN33389_c1_g1~~TRINITY_DN33389_c1_g1_i1.p1  ORF type:complete len:334 (-),score=49.76 TRINITY_DN33389_c1_g1_i1:572-1573(-)
MTDNGSTNGVGRPVVQGGIIPGVLATVAWTWVSSVMILYNKHIYSQGFAFPLFTTAAGQAFSAAGGIIMYVLGVQSLRPVPSLNDYIFKLAPIGITFAGTLYTGNLAYLYLSVSFIQILKGFTPGIVLLLTGILGLEKPSAALVLAILMIGGGTGFAVLIEQGTPAFNFFGFISFLLSSLTEAVRVVLVQVIHQNDKFNTVESLIYISGPTSIVLLIISMIFEYQGLAETGFALVLKEPSAYFLAFGFSCLTSVTCYYAIQLTSSLTFKVSGCMKNLAVVWVGVARGDVVTPSQILGYLISVFGFFMYYNVKLQASKMEKINGSKEKDGKKSQ